MRDIRRNIEEELEGEVSEDEDVIEITLEDLAAMDKKAEDYEEDELEEEPLWLSKDDEAIGRDEEARRTRATGNEEDKDTLSLPQDLQAPEDLRELTRFWLHSLGSQGERTA
jgi:hypothetical protein